MFRLIMLSLLAFSPSQPARHPHNLTPEPEAQVASEEEYTVEQDAPCLIFVNRNGDVAERCP